MPTPKKPKSKKIKAGRPPGKKSDPNYIQITGYVKRQTYRAVKIRCFEEDLEISEIMEILFEEWLKSE
jgi:hypothetical protein